MVPSLRRRSQQGKPECCAVHLFALLLWAAGLGLHPGLPSSPALLAILLGLWGLHIWQGTRTLQHPYHETWFSSLLFLAITAALTAAVSLVSPTIPNGLSLAFLVGSVSLNSFLALLCLVYTFTRTPWTLPLRQVIKCLVTVVLVTVLCIFGGLQMTNPVPPLLPTILLEVLILCLWTSRNRLAQATGDVVCIAQGIIMLLVLVDPNRTTPLIIGTSICATCTLTLGLGSLMMSCQDLFTHYGIRGLGALCSQALVLWLTMGIVLALMFQPAMVTFFISSLVGGMAILLAVTVVLLAVLVFAFSSFTMLAAGLLVLGSVLDVVAVLVSMWLSQILSGGNLLALAAAILALLLSALNVCCLLMGNYRRRLSSDDPTGGPGGLEMQSVSGDPSDSDSHSYRNELGDANRRRRRRRPRDRGHPAPRRTPPSPHPYEDYPQGSDGSEFHDTVSSIDPYQPLGARSSSSYSSLET